METRRSSISIPRRKSNVSRKSSNKNLAKQKERKRWMITELLRLGRLQQAALCCSTMYRKAKAIDDGLLLGEIWVRMGNRKEACSKHLRRLLSKLKTATVTQLVIEQVGICAQLLTRLQDYNTAEGAFIIQCQRADEMHGHFHVITSDCFMTAGAFYNHWAQIATAEGFRIRYRALACQFAGKALLVRINVLGEHDKRTAACHNNLGLLLRADGDLEGSYRELLFAREGRRMAHGKFYMRSGQFPELKSENFS